MENVPFQSRWAEENRKLDHAVNHCVAQLDRDAEDQRFFLDMLCDKYEAHGVRRTLRDLLEESPLARAALLVTYREEIAANRHDEAEPPAAAARASGEMTDTCYLRYDAITGPQPREGRPPCKSLTSVTF
jgi:hypothetical protein